MPLALLSLALALSAAAAQAPPVMPPWPLQGTAEWAATQSAITPLAKPTGLKRADYLSTIHGVVQFFRQYQNASGHIIDPFRGVETQYATPCFSFACATVWAAGLDATLLSNCSAALTAATTELATKSCADGHCVFFMKPVMFSYRILAPLVDAPTKEVWDANLQQMSPDNDFGFPSGNWGLVGTLDMLRTDYITHFGNSSWWERELDFQLGEPSVTLTPNGLYQDHSGAAGLNPLPYDTFPVSGYLTVILREGYNGTHAPLLAEVTRRAAWTHMLMQSPWGEVPTGGRSSQHTWNEAVSAVAYTIKARDYADAGDAASACMFQRAAHLSLASVKRWQNADGSLQIVKNHFPPVERWGYEEYSFLTNYNLLPASMLAAAYMYSDPSDSIPECAAPADLGGFVIALPEHHLVIANAGGVYVEIETAADPHYEPMGLNRVHINTCGVGAAGSCVSTCALLTPTAGPPFFASTSTTGVATGPWWATADAPGACTDRTTRLGTAVVTCEPPFLTCLRPALPQPHPTPAGNVTAFATLDYTSIAGSSLLPTWTTNTSYVAFNFEYYVLSTSPTPLSLIVTQDYALSVGPGGSAPTVTTTHGVRMVGAQALLDRAVERGTTLNASHLVAARSAGLFDVAFTSSPANTLARFGVQYPLFLFDGVTNTSVRVDTAANAVTVAGPMGWGSALFGAAPPPAGHNYTWSYDAGASVVSRNGLVGTAWLETTLDTQAPTLTTTVMGTK